MAYFGTGTKNLATLPLKEAKELTVDEVDGDTHLLEASSVFARRKTSTGRAINHATRSYNQTQLHALYFYMQLYNIKPTLANLTAKVIGDFIDYRRNWRFEPKRTHDRLYPDCPHAKPWCPMHPTHAWVQKTKPSPNAGRAEQITISSFVSYLSEHSKWTGSMKGVRRIKEQQTRRHLSPPEISRILAAANETANAGRDWPLTLFFFSTGLRLAEVAAMEIGDLHFGTNVVQVRPETAKNRKERTVPLYPELADVLQSYIHAHRRGASLDDPLWITTTGKPLDREALRGLGRTLAAKSKVKHFSWHLARHTMAHTSLDLGMDLLSLRLALGHENLNETMRYAKGLSAAQLAKMPSITARLLGTPSGHSNGDGNGTVPNGTNKRAVKAPGRPDGQKGRFSRVK